MPQILQGNSNFTVEKYIFKQLSMKLKFEKNPIYNDSIVEQKMRNLACTVFYSFL